MDAHAHDYEDRYAEYEYEYEYGDDDDDDDESAAQRAPVAPNPDEGYSGAVFDLEVKKQKAVHPGDRRSPLRAAEPTP